MVCRLVYGCQLLFLVWCWSGIVVASDQPNVLFIAVDDLRPELACYGRRHIHSPNIDALAGRGTLFERAYCMVPTCGASRASLMTGIRPSRERFKNYLTWAENDAPGIPTLNTTFRQQGYTTISLGKIFHHKTDSLAGWSETPWRPTTNDWQDLSAMRSAIDEHRQRYPLREKVRGMPYESFDGPDESYRDGEVATAAIGWLKRFANQPDQPFFLAVGFYKPHLPFCAPKKYWDMYDPDDIKLPDNPDAPQNAPPGAVHTSGELRAYASIPPEGPVSIDTAKKLIHGYYACVSFTDAQIGRVVKSLDDLGFADNTVVVLWGDHGWQLGEHGMWNKHSCFETSMHAPLVIAAPDSKFQQGTRVRSLVEFIDIYPTLCELSGLKSPDHLQGASLVPLMRDPRASWKSFAVGRYKTGDTIRSDTHRYTEFRGRNNGLDGEMIYDHRTDPHENTNVIERADQTKVATDLARELSLRKGQ